MPLATRKMIPLKRRIPVRTAMNILHPRDREQERTVRPRSNRLSNSVPPDLDYQGRQKASKKIMSSKKSPTRFTNRSLQCLLIVSVAYFSADGFVAQAQEPSPPAVTPAQPPTVTPPAETAPKIPNDQLDSLVAPIALYPDPLLAQTLASSTYPLELVLLEQWLGKNKNLKDKALADAVALQKWDPSVQSMAGIPDVVKRLAGNISWTTELGNAFLAQPQDVMEAVQRMRAKAQSKGALKTSQQQKVETQKVEGNKEVIVIQQSNPQVVYVPSYDPVVVYGPPSYPYYPYTYPGYVPGMGLALGTGIALGIGWANNWGNCNWNNGGDININNNNNFNRNNVNNINRNDINRNNISGGNNKWQHQAAHRGGVPYSNRNTAQKYGGTARTQPSNRPSNVNRPDTARQQPSFSDRGPSADRNRPSTSDRGPGADRNRPSTSDRSLSNSNRTQKSFGETNRLSDKQFSRDSSPRSNNAFSGPSNRMDRSSSFASHDRGSRSMASSRGGGMNRSSGMSRGGGSRGGGRRR
ncbi:MAG TPA: DUF3300 domain-containing protein [Chthoniobacterales bacterium]|nr:DUF3300 domain-containing protein [Chthoniobacterales bacterium]